jgi:guanine deaminase
VSIPHSPNRAISDQSRQHAPQYPNIGAGQQYELLKWLEQVTFPMEAKFKDPEFARKAYTKIVKRFIDAGVRSSILSSWKSQARSVVCHRHRVTLRFMSAITRNRGTDNSSLIHLQTTTCCYYGTLHVEATKELATIVHSYGVFIIRSWRTLSTLI